MSLHNIVITLVNCYSLVIIVYVLMSWIPRGTSGVVEDIRSFLAKICDPYLNLFKKLIPPIGGMVDVTPIVALLVLELGGSFIARWL